MIHNPTEAKYQLERAEYFAAEAERALQRAHKVMGEPLRSAVVVAQADVQHTLKRIAHFLRFIRTGGTEDAA